MTANCVPEYLLPPGLNGSEDVDAQAAAWLGELYSGELTDELEARFSGWMAHDRANRMALADLEQTWQDLGLLLVREDLDREAAWGVKQGPAGEPVVAANDNLANKMRKWALPAAAVLLIMVSVLSYLTLFPSSPVTEFSYASAPGESRQIALADGTELTLGAATSVSGRFSRKKRELTLETGRIFIDVHRDAERPFLLESGNARVRVLGTAFDVQRGYDWVGVSLTRGKLQVGLSNNGSENKLLSPGERVEVRRDGTISDPEPFLPSALSWREGNLEYVDMPLREVVFDLNRYRSRPIVIGDEELEDMRVTFAVPSGDTDIFLDAVSSMLPVAVEISPDHATLRKKT